MRAFLLGLAAAVLVAATPPFAKADGFAFGPPVDLPQLTFEDAEGHARTLDDYRGHVVVLNLWATWCAPCKTEMPTLGRLQAEVAGDGVKVLALAVERATPDRLEAALADLGAGNLELLRDPSMASVGALGAQGIPITVVIDKDGREVFRHLGDAEWDTPEMVARLRELAGGMAGVVKS
ncbi:MAG: TlpA family protein disulfide reductase [Geminicoccaceae bacterium]|nr:TlpA family protein disulfide reductase [Geminicoccaceae bacterium]